MGYSSRSRTTVIAALIGVSITAWWIRHETSSDPTVLMERAATPSDHEHDSPPDVATDPSALATRERLESDAPEPEQSDATAADSGTQTTATSRKPSIRSNRVPTSESWLGSAYANPSHRALDESQRRALDTLVKDADKELAEAVKLTKEMRDAAVEHHLACGNYVGPDSANAKDPNVYVMKNGTDQQALSKRALPDGTIVLIRVFKGEYPELDLAMASEADLRSEIPERVRTFFQSLQ